MRITGGQIFDVEQGFTRRDLCIDGAQISSASSDGRSYDASGCYVIPGLTDLHFHGCVGEDFSDATPEGLQAMADYELSRGITQILPRRHDPVGGAADADLPEHCRAPGEKGRRARRW